MDKGMEKAQQAGREENQEQVDFRARELREERWLGFLDTVSSQIFALRDEGKTLSGSDVDEIRGKVRRVLPGDDFWIVRSQMMKDAIIGEDLSKDDQALVWALFGKHFLDKTLGARNIIALTKFDIARRKRINLAGLLFELHQELKQKLASLKQGVKTPEEVARVAAAEKADGEIVEDLWSTRNEAVWNALFREFKKEHLKPAAKGEKDFEEEMLARSEARPKTAQEAESELRRMQGEMEHLWDTLGGMPGERSGTELKGAIPAIREILSFHAQKLDVQADQEARRQAPEVKFEELGREYDAGEIDEAVFEERITQVSKEMDKEEARVMGRVALGDARAYREAASDIPRDYRDHDKLVKKAQRLEKIARILLG